jgi:hypothetical protein
MKIDITIRDCTPEQARRIAAFIHTFEIDAGPVPKVSGETADPVPATRSPPKSVPRRPNPYGIPHGLYTTDRTKYCRLYYRCWAHNLTYEEALLRETPKQRGEVVKKPVKSPKPDKPIPPVPISIAPGVQVKQIRPDNGGRMLPSVGTVMSLMSGGEIVCVKDSEGKVHKIDIRCLEVYTQTSGRDVG